MSNFADSKTDPLWFLDSQGIEQPSSNNNAVAEQGQTQQQSDTGKLTLFDGLDGSAFESIDQIKQADAVEINKMNNAKAENIKAETPIDDNTNLKKEQEKSLFEAAKDSSDNGQKKAEEIEKSIDISDLLFNDNSGSQNAEIKINLKLDDSTNTSQNSDVVPEKEKEEATKPKIFLFIKPKINENKSDADSEKQTGDKPLSEIVSSMINLNDFISTQSQPITGNENISTSVIASNNDNDSKKVELVITIKDERKKPEDDVTPKQTNTYTNDLKTDFFDVGAFEGDRLIERLKRLNNSLEQLKTDIFSNQSVRSGNDSAQENPTPAPVPAPQPPKTEDQSSVTKQSYIRDDGARCYRMVTSTPQGRRIETRCYKNDSYSYGGRNNYSWFNDDIDRMFFRTRRLFNFF